MVVFLTMLGTILTYSLILVVLRFDNGGRPIKENEDIEKLLAVAGGAFIALITTGIVCYLKG